MRPTFTPAKPTRAGIPRNSAAKNCNGKPTTCKTCERQLRVSDISRFDEESAFVDASHKWNTSASGAQVAAVRKTAAIASQSAACLGQCGASTQHPNRLPLQLTNFIGRVSLNRPRGRRAALAAATIGSQFGARSFGSHRIIPEGSCAVKYAAIGPIAVHLPERVETNEQLGAEFPQWDLDLIYAKTGILSRHIAAPDECASDLGVAAAEKLFKSQNIDPASVDFLLFCTQTPDYPLPTTACLVQHRLGLRTSIGALDFNLGCSGFVYGLSLADGLIRSGAAGRVLLITAETYSKYIAGEDRSLRTIFGDGAAATLIEAAEIQSLSGFTFGTDGSAADALMVPSGGARSAQTALKPRTKWRWPSKLYMDGPGLIKLTLETIPRLVQQVLTQAGAADADVDLYLMHQATHKLLDELRKQMQLDEARMPTMLRDMGNTVSSTIPILLHELRASGRLRPGTRSLLAGFGVGFSWAGCLWTETWENKAVQVGELAA